MTNTKLEPDNIRMTPSIRRILFLLFFLSGFCSLVYQIVWTRMAFASFGIITPVLSVVLSVFMLGLSVGAWAGGRFISAWARKTRLSAILFYAVTEMMIGVGAFVVPKLFALGEQWLLTTGQTDSFNYLFLSALVLSAAILPWCVFMGATFPLMMAYVREQDHHKTDSFSYLYFANVLGAMSGTFLTALVLVEVLGFRNTLCVAAAGNFTIAAISVWLGRGRSIAKGDLPAEEAAAETSLSPAGSGNRLIKWILFSTGFSAMGMEVVWSRAFTPVLQTQVYSFALIVFTYLGATFIGSLIYRHDLRRNSLRSTAELISYLSITAFLPVFANNPWFVRTQWRHPITAGIFLLASICPLCAILGYLTPSLIDEYAAGRPAAAGKAYAINVVGCILGPLFASYILLPWFSERYALVLFVVPLIALYLLSCKSIKYSRRLGLGLATCMMFGATLFFDHDLENWLAKHQAHLAVRRDYAATVISHGQNLHKNLLVNGVGMTALTPITKFMVHLPLALHKGKPESALIICFGMGTSFRAALSWGIDVTAVELVPSVKDAFGFYHADSARVLNNPNGRIIIDDGRRFLKRSGKKYDLIVIDPPPPVEAAGSSLLYSKEFYEVAKQHLNPNGILQAWYPNGAGDTRSAVFRSVFESFKYVRFFTAIDKQGTHMLASMEPIEVQSADQLAACMPPAAGRDLLEWSESKDLSAYIQKVLSKESSSQNLLSPNLNIEITDDHPFNEYFRLREMGLFHP